MSFLWRITTHVDQVAVLGNIITSMLHAVILLVVHDVEAVPVYIWKDLFALVKVTMKQSLYSGRGYCKYYLFRDN